HLANHTVVSVRDVQVAITIHGHGGNAIQFGADGRAPVTRVALGTVPGHRGDYAGRRRHLANHVVVVVRDVDVAGAIHRHTGNEELGTGGRTSIARVARTAVSGHRGDGAGRRRHLANHVAVTVVDVEVAGAIQSHAGWGMQYGTGGRTSIPRGITCATPGHRGNDAGRRRHLADALVVRSEEH